MTYWVLVVLSIALWCGILYVASSNDGRHVGLVMALLLGQITCTIGATVVRLRKDRT